MKHLGISIGASTLLELGTTATDRIISVVAPEKLNTTGDRDCLLCLRPPESVQISFMRGTSVALDDCHIPRVSE